MSTPRITRREMLKAGAAALPLVALSGTASPAKVESGKPLCLTLGIATTGFHDRTNAQLAAELKQEGIHTIQFFLTIRCDGICAYSTFGRICPLTQNKPPHF